MSNLAFDRGFALSSGGGIDNFQVIVKKTDQVLTEETTLQNDTDLKFTGNINRAYTIWFWMISSSTIGIDLDYGWSIPSGATMLRGTTPIMFRNTTGYSIATDGTTEVNLGTAGETVLTGVGFGYRVLIGGTAGDVQFQGAQEVSSTDDTTIRAGCSMLVFESD